MREPIIDHPETHFVETDDGVSIAYQTLGDGPIDLVWPSSLRYPIDLIWEDAACARFLRRLASFTRLLLYDPRGSGASDRFRPQEAGAVEIQANDISVVAQAAGSDRFAVLGYSHSGPPVLVFAATHPERVSALVLLSTYAYVREFPDDSPAFSAEYLQASAQIWGTGAHASLNAPSMANDLEFRRRWARWERMAMTRRDWREVVPVLGQWDARRALPAISVPTLVVHRAGDLRVPARHGRTLAETIPNASYAEVPGDDHVFFVGDQDAVLDEIETFLTGHRPPVEVDRVLATVFFTDIVGSTERAAQLGDRAWHALLDRFRGVVRDHLERFRGREVNTRGDDFLATFDGPARAIRCARAITNAARGIGVEVRCGLHAGEVELMGDDIGGIAVHIGARVGGLAGPGEVLVSRTVADLVAGSGITFEDHGEHALKGVDGTWRLFAVRG